MHSFTCCPASSCVFIITCAFIPASLCGQCFLKQHPFVPCRRHVPDLSIRPSTQLPNSSALPHYHSPGVYFLDPPQGLFPFPSAACYVAFLGAGPSPCKPTRSTNAVPSPAKTYPLPNLPNSTPPLLNRALLPFLLSCTNRALCSQCVAECMPLASPPRPVGGRLPPTLPCFQPPFRPHSLIPAHWVPVSPSGCLFIFQRQVGAFTRKPPHLGFLPTRAQRPSRPPGPPQFFPLLACIKGAPSGPSARQPRQPAQTASKTALQQKI